MVVWFLASVGERTQMKWKLFIPAGRGGSVTLVEAICECPDVAALGVLCLPELGLLSAAVKL